MNSHVPFSMHSWISKITLKVGTAIKKTAPADTGKTVDFIKVKKDVREHQVVHSSIGTQAMWNQKIPEML